MKISDFYRRPKNVCSDSSSTKLGVAVRKYRVTNLQGIIVPEANNISINALSSQPLL